MSVKKTHSEFVAEVLKKNPNVEVLDEYINARTPIGFKCNVHDYCFTMMPTSFLRSVHGCKYCAIDYVSSCCRMSDHEFKSRLMNVSPHITPLMQYENYTKKLLVRCGDCGNEWYAAPCTLLVGVGCKKCSTKKLHDKVRRTKSEFISDVIEKNTRADTFDIIGEYKGVDFPILCKCKLCGNIWSPKAGHLIHDNGACSLCRISKAETRIKQHFEKNGINYEWQKSFDGLTGLGGGLLRYDFFIPDKNLLIEYQGEFHDGTVVYESKKRLAYQQEHDRRKREFAQNNNIELFEIWYMDKDNIEEILNKKLEIAA